MKLLSFAKFTVILAWLALIFVTSQISFPSSSGQAVTWFDYVFDKDVHVLLYGILAILVVWLLREFRMSRSVIYGVAIALALAYGIFDEWHQSFVPGRGVSVWDVVFDVLGAGGGVMLWYIWVEWDGGRGLYARAIHMRQRIANSA